MNKSDCIILTQQQKTDLLKLAEGYDFGVNQLSVQPLIDGTWSVGIEQVSSGEFLELYTDLWDGGHIQELDVRTVWADEYKWYQDAVASGDIEQQKRGTLLTRIWWKIKDFFTRLIGLK